MTTKEILDHFVHAIAAEFQIPERYLRAPAPSPELDEYAHLLRELYAPIFARQQTVEAELRRRDGETDAVYRDRVLAYVRAENAKHDEEY